MDRFSQDLLTLQAANGGHKSAFEHVLDVAYGRKGKLRWEIMKPLLYDPGALIPPRIIPAEEKSRPPVYSQELTALLTAGDSRQTKSLDKSSLITPPILPKRADLSSEEARLFGPLSRRREVNIRWRYFTREWKKVLPPLQVTVQEKSSNYEVCHETSEALGVVRAGIRGVGMQGSGILEDVENIVSPPWMLSTPTRRERRTKDQSTDLAVPLPRQRPIRWLRRRYQELLGRLPILTYIRQEGHASQRYEVTLHPCAIAPSKRYGAKRLAEADDVDLMWIHKADEGQRYSIQKQKS